MSKSIKTVLVLGLVAFVAACAGPAEEEQEIIYIEEPIIEEPVLNKYGN